MTQKPVKTEDYQKTWRGNLSHFPKKHQASIVIIALSPFSLNKAKKWHILILHPSKKRKKATMKRHSWAQFGKERVPETSRVASNYPYICTMVHKHAIREIEIFRKHKEEMFSFNARTKEADERNPFTWVLPFCLLDQGMGDRQAQSFGVNLPLASCVWSLSPPQYE